jgi:signal transduction histidine kinase
LRTPLTTFCLYTEMLADGMVQEESARSRYLHTLKGESRRLAGIVENVLAYARLGRPRPRAAAQVSVEALLSRVIPPLRQRAEQSDAQFTILEADGVRSLQVAGDEGTIERVLVNLMDNACKYGVAEAGATPRIELQIAREAGHVVLRVRDYGPGIAPAERPRVFSAFHRGPSHRSHAQSGLGLGLALARGLAVEMGGELILEVQDAPGACFALRLRVV